MAERDPEPQLAYTASPKTSTPWTVEVDVHLRSDSDPPQFDIESFLQPDEGGKLVFNNRGRDGFNVVFHIHDHTGRGYRFPEKKREAIWSQLGANACPDREIAEVFKPLRVFNDGLSLAARNKNPCPAQGEFTYTLRVTNGREWKDLDPGGINQNGSLR